MVTLLMAGTADVVFAEETTVTEPEKELVLYNTDGDRTADLWVDLRYFDDKKHQY